MQNHAEITSKVISKPEMCKIGRKVMIWTCLDLPRPVQEDKSLSAKQAFLFFLSEITLSKIYEQIYDFIESYLLLSKFMIFQQNHVFY